MMAVVSVSNTVTARLLMVPLHSVSQQICNNGPAVAKPDDNASVTGAVIADVKKLPVVVYGCLMAVYGAAMMFRCVIEASAADLIRMAYHFL